MNHTLITSRHPPFIGLHCHIVLQGCEYGVRVCSHMERYSEQYSLALSSANKWEDRYGVCSVDR